MFIIGGEQDQSAPTCVANDAVRWATRSFADAQDDKGYAQQDDKGMDQQVDKGYDQVDKGYDQVDS